MRSKNNKIFAFTLPLLDRHRAMGDVDGMVKIFTQTPLKKLMHHMKYSSTKERSASLVCSESFNIRNVFLVNHCSLGIFKGFKDHVICHLPLIINVTCIIMICCGE